MTWFDHARCREVGPEFFFPDTEDDRAAAQRICRTCPVRVDCLASAIKTADRDGIRAGFDMREIYMTARHARGRAEPRVVAVELLRRSDERYAQAAERSALLQRQLRPIGRLDIADVPAA